jgi:hypothetical protein
MDCFVVSIGMDKDYLEFGFDLNPVLVEKQAGSEIAVGKGFGFALSPR